MQFSLNIKIHARVEYKESVSQRKKLAGRTMQNLISLTPVLKSAFFDLNSLNQLGKSAESE